MKTPNLILIVLLALLFTQCESKWTKFTINKESLGGEFIMKSPNAFIDTIIYIDASLRSKLDIPDDAKIESATIKNVSFNFESLPGHISQKVNISGHVVTENPELKCFEIPNHELRLNQYVLKAESEIFLYSSGIEDINNYMTGLLKKQDPFIRKLHIRVTPVNEPGKPINIKFQVNFGYTVNYTDCFVTGNIGDDECK